MSDELTERFRAALRTDGLGIEFEYVLFPYRAALRFTGPGATPRSKRVQLVPLLIADEGSTHADLLRAIATMLDEAPAELPLASAPPVITTIERDTPAWRQLAAHFRDEMVQRVRIEDRGAAGVAIKANESVWSGTLPAVER